MFDFDTARTYEAIAARLARTDNPRHRRMLQMLLQHARGEVEGDLDAVLGSLAPHPVYKGVRQQGPQPEGFEQVRRFYIEEIFGGGRHYLESIKDRIVIDDDTIITEGTIRILRWGRDLAEDGRAVDDADAVYLMTARMLIVWPFDAECRIIGEESWTQPPYEPLRKLADEDVPAKFREYIAAKRGALREEALA